MEKQIQEIIANQEMIISMLEEMQNKIKKLHRDDVPSIKRELEEIKRKVNRLE